MYIVTFIFATNKSKRNFSFSPYFLLKSNDKWFEPMSSFQNALSYSPSCIFCIVLLLVYHFTEFLTYYYIHNCQVSVNDFVLDWKYLVFISAGIAENVLVKGKFVPSIFTYSGLFLFLSGSCIRLISMFQLKNLFSYHIRNSISNGKKLHTSGLYSVMRHPSYCGFWCISIGIQLMLGNVVYTIAAFVLLRRYFKNRIHWEEITLCNIYGKSVWLSYKLSVPHTGIPFVKID